jgi:hypothetical protein
MNERSKDANGVQERVGRALREIERIIDLAKEDPEEALKELKSAYLRDIEVLRVLRFFSGSFLNFFDTKKYSKGNLNLVSYMVNILQTINEDFFSNVNLEKAEEPVLTLEEEELEAQPSNGHNHLDTHHPDEQNSEVKDLEESVLSQANPVIEESQNIPPAKDEQAEEPLEESPPKNITDMEFEEPEEQVKVNDHEVVAEDSKPEEIEQPLASEVKEADSISETKIANENENLGNGKIENPDISQKIEPMAEPSNQDKPSEKADEPKPKPTSSKDKVKEHKKKSKHHKDTVEKEPVNTNPTPQKKGEKEKSNAHDLKERESKNRDKDKNPLNDENSRPKRHNDSPEPVRRSRTPERLEKSSKRKTEAVKETEKPPKDDKRDQRKHKQEDPETEKLADERRPKRDHDSSRQYDERRGRNEYRANGDSNKPFKKDDEYGNPHHRDHHYVNPRPTRGREEHYRDTPHRDSDHPRNERYDKPPHYRGNGSRYYDEPRNSKYSRDERYSNHSSSAENNRSKRGTNAQVYDKYEDKNFHNDYRHRDTGRGYERSKGKGHRDYPRERHDDRR